jgi:hypothetical protein
LDLSEGVVEKVVTLTVFSGEQDHISTIKVALDERCEGELEWLANDAC